MSDFNSRFCAARRAVIARDFAKLNERQREGVLTTQGPLFLLAGAGSGKTTVLINRICNILTYGRGSDSSFVPEHMTEEDLAFLEHYPQDPSPADRARARILCTVEPAAPWSVLAVTFTNKAARELRDRLIAAKIPDAESIWACTFHSACIRILRRDIEQIGFSRDFTIYNTDDSKRVIRDIIREKGYKEEEFPPPEILLKISRAKDSMLSPEDFAHESMDSYDHRQPRIAAIYEQYMRVLREANALDFDDILLHTVTLLETKPDIRAYYQNKFRYLLVDEYQDTNRLQYTLVRLLTGAHNNLCVVGDDDQSIYRFRGADIENILNFEKEFPKVSTIRLEQNYRSTQHILDAANAVIRNNRGRKGKMLWTDQGQGEKVVIYEAQRESNEADYIAGEILLSHNNGHPWSHSAVLYRINALSNALEYSFRCNGIPYRVIGGQKFFDRAEIRDMLAYLTLINNPADDLRLRRIINTPTRGIGATTVERVQELATANGVSMMTVMENAEQYPALKNAAAKLRSFVLMIDQLRTLSSMLTLPDFYEQVCELSGYTRALLEKQDADSRTRLENVQELKSNIQHFIENDPTDPSLSGFLNEIALYTDLDSANDDDDYVTLMTVHSAKGLEFPVVYVAGMDDGVFPVHRSQNNTEDMEEERRLFYVAITRAREKLTLTHTQSRMLFGQIVPMKDSCFLEEVPEENSTRHNVLSQRIVYDDYGEVFPSKKPYPRYDRSVQKTGSGSTVQSPRKTAPAAKKPLLALNEGDRIAHKSFGEGLVRDVSPMGNDALVTVEFDRVGVKKLMLKTAGEHIQKLS